MRWLMSLLRQCMRVKTNINETKITQVRNFIVSDNGGSDAAKDDDL